LIGQQDSFGTRENNGGQAKLGELLGSQVKLGNQGLRPGSAGQAASGFVVVRLKRIYEEGCVLTRFIHNT
jgi:hypothetical protein